MKHNHSSDKKLKKSLTVAVATINMVNNMLPIAIPYLTLAQPLLNKAQIDRPIDDLLQNGGQALDNLLFGRAEAGYTDPVSSGVVYNEILDGRQYILNGGTTIDTNINAGGWQIVSSGGVASNTIINFTGRQDVSTGGMVDGTVINKDAGQNVFSGGVANNTTINSTGRQDIYNKGVASVTIVNSGGLQDLYDGAIASGTTVSTGGGQNIFSKGVAVSTIVSGGQQKISIGGTASNTNIYLGGWQIIYSSGTAIANTVASDGIQAIYNNGIANSTTIDGGSQWVSSGGLANSTTINTGVQNIFTNAIASDTIVNAGGNQNILLGGVGSSTIINSGGSQTIYGGGAGIYNTINADGTQLILSGGSANSTIVLSAGQQSIEIGGKATNITQNIGGNVNVNVSSDATTLVSGQNELGTFALQSGTASHFIIYTSGLQSVYNGGISIDTTVKGGSQTIGLGGAASNTIITDNGVQTVEGAAKHTTIESGAQIIIHGGSVTDSKLAVGGNQIVEGLAKYTEIVAGVQTVKHGGTATTNILTGNGSQIVEGLSEENIIIAGSQIVKLGGTAIYNLVEAGGSQIVEGVVDNTNISSGAQTVRIGGRATNTLVEAAGNQIIEGLVEHTIVSAGSQTVKLGGTATNNTIEANGRQIVQGIADSTTIISGTQIVYIGGRAINNILGGRAIQIVEGVAEHTIISGGIQTVLLGGTATNNIIAIGARQMVQGLVEYTTISGGIQTVLMGGTANITGINGYGKQIVASGGTANNTVINKMGIVIADSGGMIADTTVEERGSMGLLSGANVNGYLDNRGYVDVTDFDGGNINLLTGSGGILAFNGRADIQPTYSRTVNIGSLSGSQIIEISVDLKNNIADKIIVNGDASGTHIVKIVKEAGTVKELISMKGAATIAQVNGVDTAQFVTEEHDVDGVAIMPTIVHNGDLWQITAYKIIGASLLAKIVAGGADMSYAAVYSGDQVLKSRIADLQQPDKESGVWVKLSGGELSIHDSSFKHATMQGGYDSVRKIKTGTIISGIMFEHLEGSIGYHSGSGKLKNSRVGIYHTWFGNSGHYYDLVFKTGRLSNELKAYEAHDEIVKAHYNTWNTSISMEYGYKTQLESGRYITPFAKLSLARINGTDYIADNGTYIRQEAINSIQGRLGISVGQNTERINWYLNAAVVQELSAKSRTITGEKLLSSTLVNNFQGTALELTLGSNIRVSPTGVLYTDISRSFGGKVVNKWQLQAGYRFNF